jgi:hypothetical protein
MVMPIGAVTIGPIAVLFTVKPIGAVVIGPMAVLFTIRPMGAVTIGVVALAGKVPTAGPRVTSSKQMAASHRRGARITSPFRVWHSESV